MEIELSRYIKNKCIDFAETRIDMSSKLYSYRGKTSREKMVEDIVVGTMGEYAVYNYLKSQNVITCKPDTKIYENRRKSYDADLVGPDIKVHVKSQSVDSAKKYGNSWLLQKTDKVIKDPGCNEYFAFCEVDVDTRKVRILGIVKCRDIVKNELLGECKVPYFRHSKVALYMSEICDKLSKRKLWNI